MRRSATVSLHYPILTGDRAQAVVQTVERELLTPMGLQHSGPHNPEIFDGDAPHPLRGCFAQAWSVAEVLRALCEDVYQIGRVPSLEAFQAR